MLFYKNCSLSWSFCHLHLSLLGVDRCLKRQTLFKCHKIVPWLLENPWLAVGNSTSPRTLSGRARIVEFSYLVNCSRVYKARPTACLTYFLLRRTSEDMVTSFLYVSIVFVKTLLFPDAYFFVNYSVWFVFGVLFLVVFFLQRLRLSFVVFTNKEKIIII